MSNNPDSNRTLQSRFTEVYKTQHPFVNAAMAFIGSTWHLPAAVINSGAMGTLAVGILSPGAMRSEVAFIRERVKAGPLNINLIVPFVSEEHIDVLCDLKPEVVSFHWGPIKLEWIEKLKSGGIDVWEQIGSAEAAQRSIAQGVDALIVQGMEAGGHNLSTLPTFVLLPEVRDVVESSMLIAAGGISNGTQVAAALSLGADAVWVGSRFIASEEANAHSIYKQQIVQAESGVKTVLTDVLGRDIPHFNPLRVLSNSTTDIWQGRANEIDENCPEKQIIGQTKIDGHPIPIDQFSSFPPVPETEGDIALMALSCGQGIGLIDSVDSVESIITNMMNDACGVLDNLQQSIRC